MHGILDRVTSWLVNANKLKRYSMSLNIHPQVLFETRNYKISKSKTHGKGIFATIDLEPGVNLGLAFIKNKNTGDPDVDYTRKDLGIYVNHSDKPNVRLVGGNSKHILYVTTGFIRKGDEIVIDYKTFPWDGDRSFVK